MDGWLKTPPPNRVEGSLTQYFRAFDCMESSDVSVSANEGTHLDGAMDIRGLRDGWIIGLRPADWINGTMIFDHVVEGFFRNHYR